MATKKYREEHREQIREYSKQWQLRNSDKLKEYNKKFNLANRLEAIQAYGGKCMCCGETTYEFLAIDHINNDGASHRRQNRISGGGIYRWLRRNNYPPGFQVLCHNCNMAKGLYGKCPHSFL